MECHIAYATCVASAVPQRSPPCYPASLPTSRALSPGREAAGMAPLSLEGWHPFQISPNTHTHTLAHSSFGTLSFNQALRRASVTSLSARRVKDLSPQVMSPTDLWTDRPLAHLTADVTAGSVSPPSSPPTSSKSLAFIQRHVSRVTVNLSHTQSLKVPYHTHLQNFIFHH